MAPSNSPVLDEEANNASEDTTNKNASNMSTNTSFPFDLTPKHHIRSPIIEETESGVEAELLRSRGNVLSSSFNGYAFMLNYTTFYHFLLIKLVKNDSTMPPTFFNIGLVMVQCRILGMMEHQKEVFGSV